MKEAEADNDKATREAASCEARAEKADRGQAEARKELERLDTAYAVSSRVRPRADHIDHSYLQELDLSGEVFFLVGVTYPQLMLPGRNRIACVMPELMLPALHPYCSFPAQHINTTG